MPKPDDRAVVGERRLRVALGLLVASLIALTAIVFLSPAVGIAIVDERLDLVINTGATLGALAISALAWARYRVTHEALPFAQAAAFLALGSVNGLVLAAIVMGRGPQLGFSLDDPGPMPVLSFVLARLVAASVLVVGGLAAVRRTRLRPRWSVVLVLAPAVLTVVLLSAVRRIGAATPLTPDAVSHLQTSPDQPLDLGTLSWGLLAVQLGIGVLFLVGAWFAYRTTIRDDRPADAYLAAGLILAAFSQVHAALNPGSFAALVTTGDVLRVAFYAVLLAGVLVQTRSDVRQLQAANAELVLLREAEVHRALVEERARLAREVHDGLAQDLWYARLKQGRLAQLVTDEEPRALAQDVMDAIDNGIADARQSVMALQAGSTDAPLLEIVGRYVDDFGDRYALEARLEADGQAPALAPRTQAELLRIVQEALNNVRKHADATVVRVRTGNDAEGYRIEVIDNGRGFRVNGAASAGFGLSSMEQRAALIGARLIVESEPQGGTRVAVLLPTRADG